MYAQSRIASNFLTNCAYYTKFIAIPWVKESLYHTYTSLGKSFIHILQDCKIYLCGTKKDLYDENPRVRQVDFHDASDYADDINAYLVETSSKTGENIGKFLAVWFLPRSAFSGSPKPEACPGAWWSGNYVQNSYSQGESSMTRPETLFLSWTECSNHWTVHFHTSCHCSSTTPSPLPSPTCVFIIITSVIDSLFMKIAEDYAEDIKRRPPTQGNIFSILFSDQRDIGRRLRLSYWLVATAPGLTQFF